MSYAHPVDAGSHQVAVLRPGRGRILAGLVVQSGTGRELSLLSGDAVRLLAMRALAMKLGLAVPAAQTESIDAQALLTLAEAGPLPPLTRNGIDEHQANVARQARVLLVAAGAADGALLDEIASFVGLFAARDLIVCRVPEGEAGLLKLEMREVLAPVLNDAPAVLDRVAIALDAVPPRCVIPMYKGGKSNDYQLEIDVGQGNFVKAIKADVPDGTVNRSGLGTQVAVLRTAGLEGTGYDLRIDVRENPNNTLLFAVGLAFVSTVVTGGLFLARNVSGVDGATTLVDLIGLFGPVALIIGAVWTAVGRSVRGRALPGLALLSIGGSISTLAIAVLSRTPLSGEAGTEFLLVATVLAAAVFIASAYLLAGALSSLASLRAESAKGHPESPLSL